MAQYTDSHFGQYAYSRADGHRIEKGDLIESFRGETWTYEGVGQPAYGNSSGRVAVSAACEDCTHYYHPDGIERRDFFPSVFGLYLGDAEGNEPGAHATVVNRGSW